MTEDKRDGVGSVGLVVEEVDFEPFNLDTEVVEAAR